MSNSSSAQKKVFVANEEEARRFERISTAITNVKNRSEKRRGPFVISDEDLNMDYCINQ